MLTYGAVPATSTRAVSARAEAAGPVVLQGAQDRPGDLQASESRNARAEASPYSRGRDSHASASQSDTYEALLCSAAEAAGRSICQTCNRQLAAAELGDMERWECFSEH